MARCRTSRISTCPNRPAIELFRAAKKISAHDIKAAHVFASGWSGRSGSPRWRASWQNTLEFGSTTVTATAYYTSGYKVAELDINAASPDDCTHAFAYDDGTPYQCRSKAIWNLDLTASHKINDQFSVYVNALNVLNIKPPFDPNAAYSLYGFNPAWAGPNITGRYFRVGAKIDF